MCSITRPPGITLPISNRLLRWNFLQMVGQGSRQLTKNSKEEEAKEKREEEEEEAERERIQKGEQEKDRIRKE